MIDFTLLPGVNDYGIGETSHWYKAQAWTTYNTLYNNIKVIIKANKNLKVIIKAVLNLLWRCNKNSPDIWLGNVALTITILHC